MPPASPVLRDRGQPSRTSRPAPPSGAPPKRRRPPLGGAGADRRLTPREPGGRRYPPSARMRQRATSRTSVCRAGRPGPKTLRVLMGRCDAVPVEAVALCLPPVKPQLHLDPAPHVEEPGSVRIVMPTLWPGLRWHETPARRRAGRQAPLPAAARPDRPRAGLPATEGRPAARLPEWPWFASSLPLLRPMRAGPPDICHGAGAGSVAFFRVKFLNFICKALRSSRPGTGATAHRGRLCPSVLVRTTGSRHAGAVVARH